MKKIILIFLFTHLFLSPLFGQFDKLLQIRENLEKKVSVGSTTDEVKKILGKPTAIEGGFPNSKELLLTTLPEQVGQLNNSTWFYFLPVRKITYDSPEEALCYLNGEQVTIDVFNEYITKDSIYIYKGKPIPIARAKSYKILRDYNLKYVIKREDQSSMKVLKANKKTSAFIPIVCVIFDKGTQVVATTKVYFQLVY